MFTLKNYTGGDDCGEKVVFCSKKNLKDINFRFKQLDYGHFNGLDLSGKDFRDSHLEMAMFHSCNLAKATFKNSFMKECWFVNCNLAYTDFRKCNMRGGMIRECKFFFTNMVNINHDSLAIEHWAEDMRLFDIISNDMVNLINNSMNDYQEYIDIAHAMFD